MRLNKWLNRFFDSGNNSASPLLYCPACDNHFDAFVPLAKFYYENWQRYGYKHYDSGEMTQLDTYSCPCCGASDRERLYALWIKQQIAEKTFANGSKLIHFAPEPRLAKLLLDLNVFEYSSADLLRPGVDHAVDITDMPFRDEQFDLFICSHVLEHVNSDDAAISELYRILKIGGRGILMAPIVIGLEKTIEDITITDNAERWRLFGQDDHVRLYAHDDYVNKIKSHGFSLKELDKSFFGEQVFHSLGLKHSSILYIVSK